MRLQGVEQGGGETEVAFHKLVVVLWAVHSGKVEHEVALLAPCVKLFGSRVEVVLEHFLYGKVAIAASLAVFNIIELGTKVFAYKALGTCN